MTLEQAYEYLSKKLSDIQRGCVMGRPYKYCPDLTDNQALALAAL